MHRFFEFHVAAAQLASSSVWGSVIQQEVRSVLVFRWRTRRTKKRPRKRLSLKLKGKERFPLVPAEQIESYKQVAVLQNTQKTNQWAVRCFQQLLRQRNEWSEEKCPEDILLIGNYDELCRWLCVCFNEMRKVSGEEYTPRSITLFIGGLLRYITSEKGERARLCDPENPSFKLLHRVLDNRFRELHRIGVGTKRKQAEVVSYDEEDQLWETGVLCSDTPVGLLRAVFRIKFYSERQTRTSWIEDFSTKCSYCSRSRRSCTNNHLCQVPRAWVEKPTRRLSSA